MEAEVSLNLFTSRLVVAEFVVNAGHGHVWFWVFGIKPGRFAELFDGSVWASCFFKNRT